MKILDRYIIKTFFGPFLFIFSILAFLFVVNILWIQLSEIVGKGLTYFEIMKFMLYAGATVVAMVLPLTILLASIMAFGEFGERYELAAMKAAGISLARIMAPLFIVSLILSVILFLFQNNISPYSQRKAKNMMYNITTARPALNFIPGHFINQIPGYSMKFDKIYGENGEYIEGIFIHKTAGMYDDQQSIIAKKGEIVKAKENKNYLKLTLYNGYIFEDKFRNKTDSERLKQPNQSIKFDTMVSYLDITELVDQAMEREQITEDYRFNSYLGIDTLIDKGKKNDASTFKDLGTTLTSNANNYIEYLDKRDFKGKKIEPQYKIDTLKKEKKIEALHAAYDKIKYLKAELAFKEELAMDAVKERNKMILYQQRILAYSCTCIILFMIGASLGSIIRKGGMGLPVVISIIIYLILHTLNISVENLTWKGELDPYAAAWIPNIILFGFSIWLSYKALTDSQVFDIEKYKALIKPLINRFSKPKEHRRYQ